MGLKAAMFGFHFLEILFFTGLLGCTVVVILSWIATARDSFSDEKK